MPTILIQQYKDTKNNLEFPWVWRFSRWWLARDSNEYCGFIVGCDFYFFVFPADKINIVPGDWVVRVDNHPRVVR